MPKSLFATAASILVKTYAIYAKHSGIPEIKTVLGGFVIKHFMGAWTLMIKSVGLVNISSTFARPVLTYPSVLLWHPVFGSGRKALWCTWPAVVQI
jgi:hypothetical protein